MKRGPAKTPEAIARVAVMADMHRQGLTLAKIGEQYGITRERVRQILLSNGITRNDGGLSVRVAHRDAAKHRVKAAAIAHREAKWGMDIELLRELRANGTHRAFEQQRTTAAARGIRWGLTFAEWYAVWITSGKIHLRGRGKTGYCMSRIKDGGGYVLGNVHIQTNVSNGREAVEQWRGRIKPIRGVFCLYPGRDKPWLAKVGKHRVGYFQTAEKAGAAREAWIEQQAVAA